MTARVHVVTVRSRTRQDLANGCNSLSSSDLAASRITHVLCDHRVSGGMGAPGASGDDGTCDRRPLTVSMRG
jgi:hypothetical protein